MTGAPSRTVAHRLSDAAFTALAAGRPDAATVAELRRSQLSRHLLLLRAIVQAAPTTTRWYEVLAAAERHAPEAVRAVLAYPLVGVWATGCLAALRSGATPHAAGVSHLAVLAAAATRRAGPPPVLPADSPPVEDGPADVAEPARRLTVTHGGLTLDVVLDDADPLRARLGLLPTGRLTDAEVTRWRDCLDDAWRLLVARHRHHAEVLAAVLTCIVPVEPDANARGISATSADAFGAVAMSAPADGTALAVGLLHEIGHSLLNAVNYLFDLHESPGEHGYSPWRDDPRPASGLLHGAYAYLAVADFWRVENRTGDPVAAFEFARWRSAVPAAAETLLTGGTLTPAGARFVGALHRAALDMLDEPVAPPVLRLAEAANADHRLRWRLRNLIVDPAAVQELAHAWRQHVPQPRKDVPVQIRPAQRRSLESSARLDLMHRLLRGDLAPGSPADRTGGTDRGSTGNGDGDREFVRGDAAGALRAYRRRIVAAPGDDAAWAGLALTGGWSAVRDRPEVVAAVYRAVADGPEPVRPDPEAVALWFDAGR